MSSDTTAVRQELRDCLKGLRQSLAEGNAILARADDINDGLYVSIQQKPSRIPMAFIIWVAHNGVTVPALHIGLWWARKVIARVERDLADLDATG